MGPSGPEGPYIPLPGHVSGGRAPVPAAPPPSCAAWGQSPGRTRPAGEQGRAALIGGFKSSNHNSSERAELSRGGDVLGWGRGRRRRLERGGRRSVRTVLGGCGGASDGQSLGGDRRQVHGAAAGAPGSRPLEGPRPQLPTCPAC